MDTYLLDWANLLLRWLHVIVAIAWIGPSLSMALTTNMNEVAAIWCLLSIGIIAVVIKTPIRRYMFVQNWPLWRFILKRSDFPFSNDLKLK